MSSDFSPGTPTPVSHVIPNAPTTSTRDPHPRAQSPSRYGSPRNRSRGSSSAGSRNGSSTRRSSGIISSSLPRDGLQTVSKGPAGLSGSTSEVTPRTDLERENAVTDLTAPPDDVHIALSTVKSVAHAARRRLRLDDIRTAGPGAFFNPTTVRVNVRWKDEDKEAEKEAEGGGAVRVVDDSKAFLWKSRDNRKGRNSIAVPNSPQQERADHWQIRAVTGARSVCSNLFKMLTTFPYWDMGFWSGWSYTWGSVLFILSGSWAYTEAAFPGLENSQLTKYAGPLCFFIGALLYELGAVMAYLEAVNDGSFQGSAMRRFLEGNEEEAKNLLDERVHSFFSRLVPHRSDEEGQGGYGATQPPYTPSRRRGAIDLGIADDDMTATYNTWRWYPSWETLRTHHVYEIGYLACSIQLFGATLYAIAGTVNLPGILSSLATWQKEGAYWVPQIVASCCFLTAGIMFTIETQERVYRPEPTALGWWCGFSAAVGSVGFLLSAIFGAIETDYPWAESQSDLSSTWGSFAYLLSGAMQWYEAVNKRPLEEMLNEHGPMKSYQVHPI